MAGRSLEARAIAWLAQREHSRAELRAKLLRQARAAQGDADGVDPVPEVDALLDRLEARGHLSQARFIDSRLRARVARHGSERIRRELADEHGVVLPPATLHALREGEFERARALWQRKFGALAPDAAGRARQARFLAGRGFPADVVRRLVQGRAED